MIALCHAEYICLTRYSRNDKLNEGSPNNIDALVRQAYQIQSNDN